MAAHWIWWILAAGLVVAELVTGTFHLLAVGVAFAIGGFVALAGLSFEVQLLVAGVAAMAGLYAASRWRPGRTSSPSDLGIDIGRAVRVQGWNPDGSARVVYRGTLWQAEAAAPDVPRADTMYIVAVRGSTLVISDQRP